MYVRQGLLVHEAAARGLLPKPSRLQGRNGPFAKNKFSLAMLSYAMSQGPVRVR